MVLTFESFCQPTTPAIVVETGGGRGGCGGAQNAVEIVDTQALWGGKVAARNNHSVPVVVQAMSAVRCQDCDEVGHVCP